MKKKIILLPLFGALLYTLLSSYSSGPATVGSLERSGATGTASCGGSGCHSSSATSTTTVSVTLLSSGTPVTTYTPGGSYTIQISGAQTSSSFTLPRFGFQLTAISNATGSPASVGTLSAPSGCSLRTISGIKIVEHSSPITATSGSGGSGTTYVINVPWTAPASGTGCVTLYGILNAVNYNFGADNGDLWNNTSTTVYEAVAAITGTTSACVGATTTLSDPTPCGTWSSSSSTVAAVGTSGVVTGNTAGTATISYTAGTGNTATTTVTVFPLPANISGTTAACVGLTTTLSDASGSGTWTTSNSSIAGTSGGSGVVTGVSGGTATISFTLTTTGCKTAIPVTINPLPGAISGTLNVCVSSTTALTDAGGGTWTSANSSIATVVGGTGVVSGVAPGTATIVYTLSTGCQTTAVVTVVALPSSITGTTLVCPSLTTTLSDASGPGTWTTTNTGTATVASGTGVVTGVSGGTATITYTAGTGCTATTVVTVNPAPTSNTGTPVVCEGFTTSLSNITSGGTWTSGNTNIATVTGGTVNGILAGTTTITYTVPGTGCVAITSLTVNTQPAAITGTLSSCTGLSSVLSDATGGGTWSSSNTTIATTVAPPGTVNAITVGTATITYKLTTGCQALAVFTVNAASSPITGTTTVCSGSTTALTDGGGGTWTSSNTTIATVGSSSGIVSGIGVSGTSNITYIFPVTGCKTAVTVTVNPVPSIINGTATVCSGSTTGLSDLTPGGTWSSSNTAVATVGTSGVVTGVVGASGTATITYMLSTTGCMAFKTVTVNQSPSSIITPGTICASGGTATLSNAVIGGTWTSSSISIAVIGTSGVVTGGTTGTATISYTLSSGCRATTILTVNALPAAITGASSVCVGTTISLTDAGGGTWSSSNTSAATVGSSTGVVSGVSTGTTTISYTMTTTGCSVNKQITVNPTPGTITGSTFLCRGLTTSLSDAGGGTWTSNNTSIATAALSTGVITGTGTGTTTITYTLSTGCKATTLVTVSALSPITGTTSLCAGSTTTLSDATTGGTWTSSNTAVATIGSSSGFVSSSTAGNTVINYTLPSGCIATATVSIVSSPGTISGNTSVCLGNTSALTDAGGGTWTSSNTSIAKVGLGTGIVTGFGLGTATITYSLGTGCIVTTLVTVNPLPSAITGPTTVCETGSIILSDATGGGTWSTAATTAAVDASGVITGVSAGTAIISYSLSSGCGAITIVTVNPSPAAISGSLGICKGSTSALSDVGGGTWSSNNTSVATIGFGTGVTAGLNLGTSSITYTLPSTGCKTSATVTVNPVPAAISGPVTVCVGATAALSNAGGGSWTSSNTNTSVDVNTGVVTGVNVGTSVITYTLPTGCSITKTITSNAAPAPIGGNPIICQGATSALSDATPSGTWSSSNTSIAGIGSTGIFTGTGAGTAVITYTRSNGCAALLGVVVNPLPAAIIGSSILCTTSLINLSDATTGGTWTSGNTAVATITPSTGDVNGVTAGIAGITYTLSTGCTSTTTLTVVPPPSVISGPANICVGSPVTFSDAVNGGTWTSSNTSVATAGLTSGIISGLSYGTTTLTYQIVSGCFSSATIRIDSLPATITGTSVICSGTTTTLSDASPGGAWSSSNTAVATAGTGTGIVSGVLFGSALITYTLPTGCLTTFGVTVNASPAAIVGSSQVCTGLTLPLSDATIGGTWSSSTTSVATVTAGLVAGIAPGTSVIAYTLSSGCASTKTVTVNPLPGTISGPSGVCATTTITLSDATSGGTWVSSKVTVATVGSTGIVSGLAAGTTVITYTLPTSCKVTTIVTVNPQPDAGTISGQSYTCNGLPVTLTNTATGGTWTSDNTTIATIDPTAGTVTAVSAGIVTISYSVTNICGTAHATFKDTIYAIPSAGAITGSDSVCAGSSIILTDMAAGGVWTSDNTTIATVSSTGTVNGVTPGNATISYSVTTPCGNATATLAIKVKSLAACNVYVHPTEMVDGYKVYPNPTTGAFIVDIPATENGAVVTVMDMLGKVIETKSTSGNGKQQVSFNIGQFARGSYMVKVNAGAVTFRQKIELW